MKPRIYIEPDQTIYVIGDSISAGLWKHETPWPEVLSQQSNLNVVNLARPGDRIEDALEQVDAIEEKTGCIILEIGGNDLLGDTKSKDFENSLEQLLEKLQREDRKIVMFELPLPPFCNRYGAIQRKLAGKYQVVLIPKRVLTKVLGTRDATTDGLHLSPSGHALLAVDVGDMFKQQS